VTRTEKVVAWVSLVGFLLVVTLVPLAINSGAPKAVSCVDLTPAGDTPAVIVRVTTDRNGYISERHLFGCTFYSYKPPPSR
jgi:hypothetical protein